MRSRASRRWPCRRDLGVSYKSAFVLLHKLREAMAEEMKGRVVGGEGKVAEVDGGYFGGYVKPRNLAENRVDRRLCAKPDRQAQGRRHRPRARRQFGPRRVPQLKAQAQASIKARIAKGTVVNADEATSWDDLHGAFRNEAHQSSRGVSASMALARIGQRNFSAAFAAPRSAITTISPAPICSATRKRLHGARIIAACPMAIRPIGWRDWRWPKRLAQISLDIGKGILQPSAVTLCCATTLDAGAAKNMP